MNKELKVLLEFQVFQSIFKYISIEYLLSRIGIFDINKDLNITKENLLLNISLGHTTSFSN